MTKETEEVSENRGEVRPRVLVVDDEDQFRPMMVAYLTHLGYPADAVADGTEAIKTIRAGRHGIVLLDCKMPGIDGCETTRQIRALDLPGGQPRIVGFSGDDRVDLRMECMAAGMDGYLPKPFTEEELRAALERVR